jgi:hypothetical protein
MKPYIKICTPFYNEWDAQLHPNGTGTPIRNEPPLPIEEAIDKLAQMAGFERYEPGMIVDLPAFTFRWVRVRGTYIARSRNALVNRNESTTVHQTLSGPETDILFVDSDVEPTYDAIVRLLGHNLPIVSGAYIERTHSTCVTGGDIAADGLLIFFDRSLQGLRKAQWVGAGFLLIKKFVFEKMPYKWFDCSDFRWIDGAGVEHVDSYEDDVTFSINARKAGFDLYLDCNCKVTHHLTNRPKKGVSMPEDRVLQLKGYVYDLSAQIQACQGQIQIANAEIGRILQEREQAAVVASQPSPGAVPSAPQTEVPAPKVA